MIKCFKRNRRIFTKNYKTFFLPIFYRDKPVRKGKPCIEKPEYLNSSSLIMCIVLQKILEGDNDFETKFSLKSCCERIFASIVSDEIVG